MILKEKYFSAMRKNCCATPCPLVMVATQSRNGRAGVSADLMGPDRKGAPQ